MDESLDPDCLRSERPRKRPAPKLVEVAKEPEWTPQRFADAFPTPIPLTINAILQAAKQAGVSKRKAKDLLQISEDVGLIQKGHSEPARSDREADAGLVVVLQF